jgi:DNA-binding Lrp family transcriptional regulator
MAAAMVTQSDIENQNGEDETMSKGKPSDITRKLSPSAQAIIRFIRQFELGEEIDVFSEDDADFQNLYHIASCYKGSLFDDVSRRLNEVAQLGGVEIVTQRDVMSLVTRIWEANISILTKREIPFLEASLKNPEMSLRGLSQKAGLSYAQSRRAQKRLTDSGVLRIGGMLNTDLLGLERVLILQESPSLVLSGPYSQKHLFVDGYAPLVLQTFLIPHTKRKDFMNTVRSLRSSTTNVSVFALSTGRPNFSGLYSSPRNGWNIDLLHFRLLLRKGGEPIVLSDIPSPSIPENTHLAYSDTRIMDELVESLDGSANDIAENTGLSLSTAFRKRANLLQNGIILPRGRVNIPELSDRVAVICGPEAGGNIQVGWQDLPLTFTSQIQNLEDRSEKKMLLLSALPTGSAQSLLDVLYQETSRADDLSAWKIAAGIGGRTKVSSMFDRHRNTWLFDTSQHFDALPYSVARKDASLHDISIDLAE